jgi:hypothetical protein
MMIKASKFAIALALAAVRIPVSAALATALPRASSEATAPIALLLDI